MGGGVGGGGPGHCAEGGGGLSEHMASLHMTHCRREESNNAYQTELGLNALFPGLMSEPHQFVFTSLKV